MNNIIYKKPYAQSTYWSLLLANLIPIFGVLFLGWKALDVILFYWIETIIIGLYNMIKIYWCNGKKDVTEEEMVKIMGPLFEWMQKQNKDKQNNANLSGNNTADLSKQSKWFLIFFFLFHYNFFIFVQLIFILGIDSAFGGGNSFDIFNPLHIIQYIYQNVDFLLMGILGIVFSHGHSLYLNFIIGKEYEGRNPAAQMFQPYGRIFIQQFVVILGTMISMILGSPIFLMVLLVVIKTTIDLFSHHLSHKDISSIN